jgi:hypothetical protein
MGGEDGGGRRWWVLCATLARERKGDGEGGRRGWQVGLVREIGAVWTIEMVLEACLKRDERSVLLYQLGCGREDEPAKREGSTQQSRPYTTRMEEADQCEFI